MWPSNDTQTDSIKAVELHQNYHQLLNTTPVCYTKQLAHTSFSELSRRNRFYLSQCNSHK